MDRATADQAQLRGRLEDLGLDSTSRLHVEDTITEQTLVLFAAQRGDASIARAPPAGDLYADVDMGELPRITLGATAPDSLEGARGGQGSSAFLELAVLGEGGMGRVLLVHQSSLDREVAVKVLKPDAGSQDATSLVREARITGALEHPSIVPVHALGIDDHGQPLLVMKRVEGVSWLTLVTDEAHPAWKTQLGGKRDTLDVHLDVLVAVCRALELAHARGIIHRDVKPENVMVGAFGEVYLVDWGIATTVAQGARETAMLGTPGYMAPEMVTSGAIDQLTDVYLLGATLHRVLAKRPRHTGTVMEALLAAALSEPVAYPPTVPAPLAALCNRACAADRRRRPPSAAAFREELVAFNRHRSAVAICSVASERIASFERLLADAGATTPVDLAAGYRLVTEARFGFTQSLEQFPEQGAAREGIARCLRALVDFELRQGHVDTAAALLDELPGGEPELAARLAAARTTIAEAAREHGRLRMVDRTLDPTIERGARVAALALMVPLALGAGITGYIGRAEAPTHLRPVFISVAVPIVTLTVSFAMRRRLFASVFNRRIIAVALASQMILFLHRLVGYLWAIPRATTATSSVLSFAAVLATLALTMLPRIAVAVPPLLVGAFAILAYPGSDEPIFSSAMAVALGTVVWAVWTHRRSEPPSPVP